VPELEPGGCETCNGSISSDIDLALLKDFLLVLQSCQVARFSGYGVSVDFRAEGDAADFAPRALGAVKQDAHDESSMTRETKDAWRNPNLWPQQNGKVLKFDGSLE
jgi:hypothetical protein